MKLCIVNVGLLYATFKLHAFVLANQINLNFGYNNLNYFIRDRYNIDV